jgi:hypothetical protein
LCLNVSWVLADTPDDAKQRQREAMQAEQAHQEEQEAMRQFEKYEARREFETARAERAYRHQVMQQEQAAFEHEIQRRMEEIRQLRLRQVDLEAAMQRAGLADKAEQVREAQLEMVELQHELRTSEFELQRLMMERDIQAERRDMMTMTDRLEYVAGWRDVAFDPPQAIMMATQAIVELHMARDDAPGAVSRLEKTLNEVRGTGVRTAIRFALRDLYTELDEPQQAVEHMLHVILENARYLNGGSSE